MPYIPFDDRPWADIDQKTVGELNYKITRICNTYLNKHMPTYEQYNAVIGVLECAKLEMYRRAVAPYEDQKRNLNGDCYP
jgi:hypothetical protein